MRFKDAFSMFCGFYILLFSVLFWFSWIQWVHTLFMWLCILGLPIGNIVFWASWNDLEKIGNWIYKFRR